MTGSDLIVEIPWLFLGLSLAAIWLRIRRSRGPRRRPPEPEAEPSADHADSGRFAPAARSARSDQQRDGQQ